MSRILCSDRTLKPIFAALFMGGVVVLSLLWTQKGIHVSGVYSLLCPSSIATESPLTNELFCSTHSPIESKGWIVWMAFGIFTGAFLTSFWRSRGLKFRIERGQGVRPGSRLLLASLGGLVVGFGAALAGGCTSSIGLTGSALLSVAAFLFLCVFFIGGFMARIFFGRFWHG